MPVYHWRKQTTADLAHIVEPESVALLPMAAVEQHGPHLPLDTDIVIGEGIVDQALSSPSLTEPQSPGAVVLLPTLTIGASDEHTDFAGTLSLSPETAIATLEEMGQAVARAGIPRLVVFNSHGGNKAVLDIAALNLRRNHGLSVVKATYFRFGTPADVFAAEELTQDLHAGAIETSLMLHLAPDSVRADQIPSDEAIDQAPTGEMVGPEGRAAYAWLAKDFGDSGIAGRPAQAKRETGRLLLDHFGDCLAQIIDEARRLV